MNSVFARFSVNKSSLNGVEYFRFTGKISNENSLLFIIPVVLLGGTCRRV